MAPFRSEVFHIHEYLELCYPGGSLQVASALGSPIRRPHFAVRGDSPRAPGADRLAPAHLGFLPHADHAGVLRCGYACLSLAHEHQLRLLCDPRTDRPPKNFGRRSALRPSAPNDILRLRRIPPAPPLVRPATYVAPAF